MPEEMCVRAISIKQPLIELILRGEKKIEWRTRPTNIRERVYLYASQTLKTVDGFAQGEAQLLPRGVIVGSVEITDCILDEDGSYGYVLARPRRYAQPIRDFQGHPAPVFWRPTFR